MQAVFEPLVNQIEAMHTPEGPILRTAFTDAVSKVSFTSSSDDGSSSSSFEDATGLGLEASDVGEADLSHGDPFLKCMAFSDSFLLAADACVEPVCESIQRCALILGGLHIKVHMKMVGAALGAFVKKMSMRSEELRQACGLSLSNSTGSNSGAAARTPGGRNVPPSPAIQPTATELTESWARKLEAQQLVASNWRELLPSILRSLQTAGRLLRNLDKIDVCVSEVCSAVGVHLASLTNAEELSQKTLEVCRSSMQAAIDKGCGDSDEERLSFLTSSNGGGELASVYASYLTLQTSAYGDLRHTLRNTGDRSFSLSAFSAVSAATWRLKLACGCLFFDAATASPTRLLSDYAGEVVWSLVRGTAGSNTWTELTIDDNLLSQPSDQCGEHLLSLVQDLSSSPLLTPLLTSAPSRPPRPSCPTVAGRTA